MSWMQKAYDVDGNLYWATTTYNKIELNQHGEDNITRPIDPYADPQRMSERWIANGDGYLFYPGAKYGADYPFASMRLEAIRDGLEEYEYLRQLETLYAGASEYYGMEISAEKKLSGLYSRLFSGTIILQKPYGLRRCAEGAGGGDRRGERKSRQILCDGRRNESRYRRGDVWSRTRGTR